MASWQQAFDVINQALGVISSASSMPGVNLIPYVNVVASAAGALQGAIKVGHNITPYILAIKSTFSDELPSASQLSALDVKIKELEALIDAPLPPREDGEPE